MISTKYNIVLSTSAVISMLPGLVHAATDAELLRGMERNKQRLAFESGLVELSNNGERKLLSGWKLTFDEGKPRRGSCCTLTGTFYRTNKHTEDEKKRALILSGVVITSNDFKGQVQLVYNGKMEGDSIDRIDSPDSYYDAEAESLRSHRYPLLEFSYKLGEETANKLYQMLPKPIDRDAVYESVANQFPHFKMWRYFPDAEPLLRKLDAAIQRNDQGAVKKLVARAREVDRRLRPDAPELQVGADAANKEKPVVQPRKRQNEELGGLSPQAASLMVHALIKEHSYPYEMNGWKVSITKNSKRTAIQESPNSRPGTLLKDFELRFNKFDKDGNPTSFSLVYKKNNELADGNHFKAVLIQMDHATKTGFVRLHRQCFYQLNNTIKMPDLNSELAAIKEYMFDAAIFKFTYESEQEIAGSLWHLPIGWPWYEDDCMVFENDRMVFDS